MTEAPRTPDHLNDLDRRVYDLAVQTMPLAEIAVRLGISIRQADEKVQRILERMCVPDRESLRVAANLGASSTSEQDEPESETQDAEPAPDPTAASISRRHILIGGASLAVLAGGAAVGFRASNHGNGRTPAATPTESAAPTLFVSTPIPFPRLPIQEERGLGFRFEIEQFRETDLIDWQHGLFKVYPDSQRIEAFRFLGASDGDVPGWAGYRTGEGGRYIWATEGPTQRQFLADLSSGRSWSWPMEEARLIAAFDVKGVGSLVFERLTTAQTGTGVLTIFRMLPGSNELWQTGEVRTFHSSSIVEPLVRDRFLALWRLEPRDLVLQLVDIPSATVLDSFTVPRTFRGLTTPFGLELQHLGPERFLARWAYLNPDGGLSAAAAVLDWESPAPWTTDAVFPTEYVASVQPDKGAVVEQFVTRDASDGSHGNFDLWTTVALRDDPGGADSFRLRSASTSYGDNLPHNRWLADGSGFLAMVRGPETDGSNLDAYEYAIISADGRTVTRIPLPPPGGEPRWWNQNAMRGAVPSPFNPNLISFGRTDLYYVTPGAWLRPNVTSEDGPDHLDPWGAGPEFMVFSLPHGGHGGASPPVLLNLKREEPPYLSRHFIFVVAGTGDSLRLRAEPSLDAEILANLPDGTQVTLHEDPTRPEGLRAVDRADGILWIRVRTLSGESGWVSSTYLAWE